MKNWYSNNNTLLLFVTHVANCLALTMEFIPHSNPKKETDSSPLCGSLNESDLCIYIWILRPQLLELFKID